MTYYVDASYLEAFVSGYVECALWSSHTKDGTPLDEVFDRRTLPLQVVADMARDCSRFTLQNAADLSQIEPGQAGHDFWLTRNGHGAGYWDRGLGELGERLSEAARAFGESDVLYGIAEEELDADAPFDHEEQERERKQAEEEA